MVNGAIANAAVQGIAVATKLQDKFDWAGVAAAGVSAGVSGQFNGPRSVKTFGGKLGAQVVGTTAASITSSAAYSLVSGADFGDTLIATLPTIIGQSAGMGLVAKIGSGGRGGWFGVLGDGGALGRAIDFPFAYARNIIGSVGEVVGNTVGNIVAERVASIGAPKIAVAAQPASGSATVGFYDAGDGLMILGALEGGDRATGLGAEFRDSISNFDLNQPVGPFDLGFGKFDTRPPVIVEDLRKRFPGFGRMEDRIWNLSQGRGYYNLRNMIFGDTSNLPREHALAVYMSDNRNSLKFDIYRSSYTEDGQYNGIILPRDPLTNRVDLPKYDGFTLILLEHTHPFPVTAILGIKSTRGPSIADMNTAKDLGVVNVIRGLDVDGRSEFLYYGPDAGVR